MRGNVFSRRARALFSPELFRASKGEVDVGVLREEGAVQQAGIQAGRHADRE